MPKKNAAPVMKLWKVRYRSTYDGITEVEAATAAEARAKVDAGDFEEHPCAERVDWESVGDAREA